ncbi:response regulator with CheY-like receiver domain and winged-helix DNA-binding domain [Rhizobium leguminosarum bv. trifolii WSM597]|uniref:Response regulator with CheY-like receiver domain and winged-helix DNA-binding domain n=1 Tax=Rhizobium leguminosarum bv. trifolii WSM597 TaxID=754764 RepID=I9X4R7_RHILT|nr:response regulator transcription factor [Rhizobium leguminosarum]EJB03791.1 response regulator with CheY-like receiver domain and winged-helix DNA-binding domain [Rhizobium leguminosarum bv. trifolii WSM597]
MRLLLVEDDRMIAEALLKGLGRHAISVDWVTDGKAALEAVGLAEYGVVLLDLGLPRIDGMQVLESIRKAGKDIPILILTARDDLPSRVKGLDLGADDYVLKPFELDELLARIRAVMRRKAGHAQSLIQAGEVTLDLATYSVTFREVTETLSAREFALLRILAERPGLILSRSQLEERIYGWGEEIESNAIEVLIHYIRKRFHKDVIRNVRGAGWMIPKA